MRHRRQDDQKGLTLLELMITVAVIGILAVIAVPAYRDYVIRARVSEALMMASAQKIAVVESYASNGLANVTADSTESQVVENPSLYVAGIEVEDGGRIIMRTRNTGAVINPVLALAPNEVGDALSWNCELLEGLPTHVPARCRGAGATTGSPVTVSTTWPSSSGWNVVTVASVADGGFKVTPVGDDVGNDDFLAKNAFTRGQPQLVDTSKISSGTFALDNVRLSGDTTYGGWGIAVKGNETRRPDGKLGFSGYTVQFEPAKSTKACGGTGPCIILMKWVNGRHTDPLNPPGPTLLPSDFYHAKPGNISVGLKGNSVSVTVNGTSVFSADNLEGPDGGFGVRSWSKGVLDVGGSTITTP